MDGGQTVEVTMSGQITDVLSEIDEDETIELAKQLVDIPSPPGEEGEVAEFIVEWLESNGVTGWMQEIEPERYNAVGRVAGTAKEDGNSLMFNGHLDTSQGGLDPTDEYLVYGDLVEHRSWQPDPYMEDGRIYGAGISNDKGPIASFLIAAKAIAEADVELAGDLLLAGVAAETGKAAVDEYQGPKYRGHGIGTRHLLNGGITADYAVVVESSRMGVNWALPGVLYLKLELEGHAAYIPYIDNERHAIYDVLDLAEHVREWGETYTEENTYDYEKGKIVPNVNVGSVRAGSPPKPNYAPGVAQLFVDIRVPPQRSPRDVEREFTQRIREFDPGVDVTAYRAQRGSAPSDDDAGITELADVAERCYREVYGSDPPDLHWEQHSRWHDTIIYHHHDIPAIKWGPGPGPEDSDYTRRSLSPDELVDAAKAYASCALSICGTVE